MSNIFCIWYHVLYQDITVSFHNSLQLNICIVLAPPTVQEVMLTLIQQANMTYKTYHWAF